MALDLLLAILHHLLVFALAAALAVELALVRPGLAGRDLRVLAHVDQAYGALAGGVLLVGALRVVYGLKGWEFYVYSTSFWAKMLAFAVVGALSIAPTLRIAGGRRGMKATTTGLYVPPDAEISAVRRFIRWQLVVFLLIPVFAAMMARGIY